MIDCNLKHNKVIIQYIKYIDFRTLNTVENDIKKER